MAVGNPPSSSSHGLGGATLGKELGLSSNLGPFPGASGAAEDLVPAPGSALFQLPLQPRASWLMGCGWNLHFHRLAPRRGGDGDCLPAFPSQPVEACLCRTQAPRRAGSPRASACLVHHCAGSGLPRVGPGPLGVQRARYPVSPEAAPALPVSCDLN